MTFIPVLALIAAVLFLVAVFFTENRYEKLLAAAFTLLALSLWR